jgi:hypothetical protein
MIYYLNYDFKYEININCIKQNFKNVTVLIQLIGNFISYHLLTLTIFMLQKALTFKNNLLDFTTREHKFKGQWVCMLYSKIGF